MGGKGRKTPCSGLRSGQEPLASPRKLHEGFLGRGVSCPAAPRVGGQSTASQHPCCLTAPHRPQGSSFREGSLSTFPYPNLKPQACWAQEAPCPPAMPPAAPPGHKASCPGESYGAESHLWSGPRPAGGVSLAEELHRVTTRGWSLCSAIPSPTTKTTLVLTRRPESASFRTGASHARTAQRLHGKSPRSSSPST